MAGTGAKRHTHKYFRLPTDKLWHCALPACSHYMPGNMPPPVYKLSLCNDCEREFQLTPDNMRRDHPVCDKCEAKKNTWKDDAELEAMIEKDHQERLARRAIERAPATNELTRNEVTSEAVHTDSCRVNWGGICTCGADW